MSPTTDVLQLLTEDKVISWAAQHAQICTAVAVQCMHLRVAHARLTVLMWADSVSKHLPICCMQQQHDIVLLLQCELSCGQNVTSVTKLRTKKNFPKHTASTYSARQAPISLVAFRTRGDQARRT